MTNSAITYLYRATLEAAEVRMTTPTHVDVIAQPAIVRRFSSSVKSAIYRTKLEVKTWKYQCTVVHNVEE